MHKYTKLTSTLRRHVYQLWEKGFHSYRKLGKMYHVDKNVIRTVVLRGKIGDFTIHDSTNHRYRTIEYGLKRLDKIEQILEKKLRNKERRKNRYEKMYPGEMLHGDTKKLPPLRKGNHRSPILIPRQTLFIAIDDHSRYLTADLLPDKTMWSSAIFLENIALRLPFKVERYYTDNGSEYKGNDTHAVPSCCARLGIQQQFTQIKHPWTNGKAERVIKTLLTEWYLKEKSTFINIKQMKESLYKYVDYYNHERSHQSLNSMTPIQKLTSFYEKNGDNA